MKDSHIYFVTALVSQYQIEQLLGGVPQDKGAQAPPEPTPSVAEAEKPQAEASAPAEAVG